MDYNGNHGKHKVIAEVDWDSAFTALHDEAIYAMASEQYHVDKLDLDGKKACIAQRWIPIITDAMTYTKCA